MASRELPLYTCHKRVRALKIESVDLRVLHFADKRYAPIEATVWYMLKHRPEAGGYYVVYEDGYTSYSPAKAFEEGYTLAGEG